MFKALLPISFLVGLFVGSIGVFYFGYPMYEKKLEDLKACRVELEHSHQILQEKDKALKECSLEIHTYKKRLKEYARKLQQSQEIARPYLNIVPEPDKDTCQNLIEMLNKLPE